MKVIVEICTDGAAFQENAGRELTRLFTVLASDIRNTGGHPINSGLMRGWLNARQLRDTNGDTCGNVRTEE